MLASVVQFTDNIWSQHVISKPLEDKEAQLVLGFGAKEILQEETLFTTIKAKFPNADIALCSTAGEIYQDTVQDNTLVAVAMSFTDTRIKTASVTITDYHTSFEAAKSLSTKLLADDLKYIMVLSDGCLVNGSELVKGFAVGAKNVLVTGGLAGDAAEFKSTLVGLNEQPTEGKIVAIGFYGNKLVVTHGSKGGWDMFGLEKEITRSEGNVLYDINNENALAIYKKYLGPDSEKLPGSALLFPLSVTSPGTALPVVRTILAVDDVKKSMTFAGDVPIGSKVRFMKANFDKLTAAAAAAAQQTRFANNRNSDFSLLVSCVGRKLIYGPRIDEEVEAVSETLGNKVPIAGFYANGEISPFYDGGNCQLHNQTMTITSFYELP
ncbi:FIST signal transduction protein [Fibrivirga algicola]|uniref:Histidine kinase n=1 Tax=Fibrivirga algicola TaxID=2950420 RepID=A0ABX0QCK5_9BACT|nr:FIST N-terminal domain-containing protein [Fibrivirga algicola]ARK10865.1 histidine kinase [Fibrella sp. ES10-3-2-2]NID09889.1 histidine kinase [Fibrivirga algicola]